MNTARSLGLLVVFGLSLAGCATLNGDAPSAMVAGREMAPGENGHVTLSHRQGTGEIRSEGDVRVSGNRLILDGRIVAPSALAGTPVRHEIWRTECGLFGDVDTFFLGHRVHADLLLQRTTL